jgi:NADH-quinone oxidoreductase subunit N
MYFDVPEVQDTIEINADARFVLSLNGLSLLALGILPSGLMAICTHAIVELLV